MLQQEKKGHMRRLPDAYKKFDLGIIKKLGDININLPVKKCRGRDLNIP